MSTPVPAALECRVCQDGFGPSGERVPRLLSCGHSVCSGCLGALLLQQGGPASARLLCPFDRQPTLLTPQGVLGLKKNFALLELMDNLSIGVEAGEGGGTESVLAGQPAAGPVSPSQASPSAGTSLGSPSIDLVRERLLGVPCDEVETHLAVLFCTVCESHLCERCSESSHSSRVLARHRRVPLSEKPAPRPRCPFHSAYGLEFVCKDAACEVGDKLMCLLCRDYGRHAAHRHALLEVEAAERRKEAQDALASFRATLTGLADWQPRVAATIRHITGDAPSPNGQGSADDARAFVRLHFAEQRQRLAEEEAAAQAVLDAHVQERLTGLRGQQSELASASAQLSAVCRQLDSSVALDDARLVASAAELASLSDAVRKHQAQLGALPAQLRLEPRITLAFTKDNRLHIGPKVEVRVVVLGLDSAGKTAVLFKLKHNELCAGPATIGFNVETLDYQNLKLTVWDVGGLPKLRPLWKHYYLNTQAVIFVVDSAERERLAEVQSELVQLLSENALRDAALLLLANKQDQPEAMSGEQLASVLTLQKLCYGRSWHVQPCDAVSGEGLWEGIDWLARQLLSSTLQPPARASTT